MKYLSGPVSSEARDPLSEGSSPPTTKGCVALILLQSNGHMMNEVVKIRMEQLGGVGIPTLGGSVGGSNLDFHEIFLRRGRLARLQLS